MADDLDDLARLRGEIDRVDDAIVDLLAERMSYVRAVASAKGVGDGRLAIRPSREASILRRLTKRADCVLPDEALVRIWREIIGTATIQQTPFSVAVAVPAGVAAIMELARGHFGTGTPLIAADTSMGALEMVAEGRANVAVVGSAKLAGSWWTELPWPSMRHCAVFGSIPFAERSDRQRAWLFGPVTPEPSGDDLSLIRATTGLDVTESHLVAYLAEVGLPCCHLGESARPELGERMHLLEVGGFFAADGIALAEVLVPVRHQLVQCNVLGTYPSGIRLKSG